MAAQNCSDGDVAPAQYAIKFSGVLWDVFECFCLYVCEVLCINFYDVWLIIIVCVFYFLTCFCRCGFVSQGPKKLMRTHKYV